MHEKLSKSSNSSTAPKAEGLPLNTPSKGIVDKAYLINFSDKYLQIFSDSGINIQHSIPYTPQQNGAVERKNRSLKEMITCILDAKGLDENLWDKAINFSAHN